MKGTFTASHARFRRNSWRTLLLMCALTIADASLARGGGNSTPYSGNSALASSEAQSALQSATREISGQIFDAQGTPLIGATVMIKGTSKGIHTDTDGKFTLTIPNTGKVVVLSDRKSVL